MPTSITLVDDPSELGDVSALALLGRREFLLSADARRLLPADVNEATWEAMVGRGEPGDDGNLRTTWRDAAPKRLMAGVLPEQCSRHNAPSRPWSITRLVQGMGAHGEVGIVLVLDDPAHAFASVMAVARALPSYSAASKQSEVSVKVAIRAPGPLPCGLDHLGIAADAVRRAAHWVDAPPSEFDTRAFVAEARAVARRHLGVGVHTVVGSELQQQGFGGLWGVGKAAESPPALIVLEYLPEGSQAPHEAWVGKGIVYDTGGLSIKSKTGMPGMKTDMAGAAAVLAAFEAAVRIGVDRRLTAVLCVAENAIGPLATRPDDILHMYSGRTVEVNNTDAEGRLVLADGVAWVTRHREPTRMVDLATLTGAQSISTGKRHAALYASDEGLESEVTLAGRASGDLVHALPYCPEFFRREFQSRVADMRNSVKDRSNGQCSCAAEFIRQHIVNHDVPWVHVDMAGPSVRDGRATGFGVGLLLGLAGVGT